jgi:hypothetical protein
VAKEIDGTYYTFSSNALLMVPFTPEILLHASLADSKADTKSQMLRDIGHD